MRTPLVVDRAVFRQNGDAALFFDRVGIHDPLGDLLVRGEGAGLLEQALVDQRGLAVVDVGNDGDVSEGAGHRDGWACCNAEEPVIIAPDRWFSD
jgi:hypothetical protein